LEGLQKQVLFNPGHEETVVTMGYWQSSGKWRRAAESGGERQRTVENSESSRQWKRGIDTSGTAKSSQEQPRAAGRGGEVADCSRVQVIKS
jgi:hypothetical protein